jgi:hypothetical protein
MSGAARCFMLWSGVMVITVPAGRAWAAGLTSLTDPHLASKGRPVSHVELARGPVAVIVVDNAAMPPAHRAGYNGIASLTHTARRENVFVPEYAGLNFELIHDGTQVSRDRMMEPRRAPMTLRRVDENTVELHQPPTPTWLLESCTRLRLLADGAIEMAFECIPRKATFTRGTIGLFWASYIQRPESKAIHFLGVRRGDAAGSEASWIEAITPKHGVESTHVGVFDERRIEPADDFPMHYMAFSYSPYRYVEPYYYGVSHGMAVAMVFRKRDMIRFTQSPSGGGEGNPAWDFQFMIPDYRVGKAYGFVMRLIYMPMAGREELARVCRRHVAELSGGGR